jgi:hypothetical protein
MGRDWWLNDMNILQWTWVRWWSVQYDRLFAWVMNNDFIIGVDFVTCWVSGDYSDEGSSFYGCPCIISLHSFDYFISSSLFVCLSYVLLVALGGLVVVVVAMDRKFAGSDSAEGDRVLRAIKIRSTTSFGGKYSRWAHVVRFYGILKIPQYESDTCRQNSRTFLAKILLLCYWVSAGCRHESSHGWIRNDQNSDGEAQ